jgi:hypothetical protein
MESSRNETGYLAAVLSQKNQDDPKESAIREKISSVVLREEWARAAFARVRSLQVAYLRDTIAHVADTEYVHAASQKVLRDIVEALPSQIVEGRGVLETLPKGKPVLVATNHFGAYKLLGIHPKEELGVDIPGYTDMYPFPAYFAALHPVAQEIGLGLYYSSNDFPGVFGEIHSKSGFIHIPALKEGRTAALIEQTRHVVEHRPESAIVIFPEGTTSGKPTGMGPYALNPFKTGAYVLAAELALPVVLVAQYFHPTEGFKLKIFSAAVPVKTDKAGYEALAAEQQHVMQEWLSAQER